MLFLCSAKQIMVMHRSVVFKIKVLGWYGNITHFCSFPWLGYHWFNTSYWTMYLLIGSCQNALSSNSSERTDSSSNTWYIKPTFLVSISMVKDPNFDCVIYVFVLFIIINHLTYPHNPFIQSSFFGAGWFPMQINTFQWKYHMDLILGFSKPENLGKVLWKNRNLWFFS